MNYFDYKFFHFLAIIIFVFNLCISSYNPEAKIFKITQGIISLILLLSGFLLMKRFGIEYDQTYPMWIWIKIVAWAALAMIPPIIIKRMPKLASKFIFISIFIIAIAAFMGIYKLQ